MSETQRRRRIDRVSDPSYLDAVASRSIADIRVMRDDCREEEVRLSYARRLVQGQLDIVRAEHRRRGGEGEVGDLVDSLSQILADAPAPGARSGRPTPVFNPTDDTYGHREHDTSADDSAVGRVPDLDDAELAELEDRLVEKERQVSQLRRTVLDHLDALSDELVRRYRDGDVDVDDIMASTAATEPREDS